MDKGAIVFDFYGELNDTLAFANDWCAFSLHIGQNVIYDWDVWCVEFADWAILWEPNIALDISTLKGE